MKPAAYCDIEVKALQRLSLREHTRSKLYQKLRLKKFDTAQIGFLLDRLVQKNLLSDQCFSEGYVCARVQKSFGPIQIKHVLKARGVAISLIEAVLFNPNIDWYQAAYHAKIKKYGTRVSAELKIKRKQTTFLHYCGFEPDQIRYAIEL